MAVVLFAATIGLSIGLNFLGINVNLSIPILIALIAVVWYGGFGPGLLISALFHGTTVVFGKERPEGDLAQQIFSHLSIFLVYVIVAFLISRLHNAHRRLREQNDLLQTTLMGIGDAVIVANTEGSVRFLNPAAKALTGYNDETAIGLPIRSVARIVSEDEENREITPAIQALAAINPIGPINHSRLVAVDGRETPIEFKASPLKKGTDAAGLVLVLSNVTDRVRSKELVDRRSTEIAALYEFSHRLQSVTVMAEVYEAALDSVYAALRCDRASILLFDEWGVMQFVASRGLSGSYRSAVAGHSPWKREDRDPVPFSIDEVAEAEMEPHIRTAVESEGVQSLGFIPLISNSRLIGKLMVYFDQPHHFTAAEFELGQTVASQIATGLERKQTENRLVENEERLRLATQTGKVGVWDWDIRSNRLEWTDSLFEMHGISRETFGGGVDDFSALVHPDDREELQARLRAALDKDEPYDLPFRIVRPDGEVRWLFANAIVQRDENGPYRMLGATADTTEQMQVEAARRESEIMHRLVDAQEEERRRIARDLHDHLGQRMTALRLKLEALSNDGSLRPEFIRSIEEVRKYASELDRDIGFLSWELRPLELEIHGLTDALSSYVREWSRQHGIDADFEVLPASMAEAGTLFTDNVETNVYRILQEALNNVLKHSRATRVSVLMHIRIDNLQLVIEDNGEGFDPSEPARSEAGAKRIGLVGMRERTEIMHGEFEIDSRPGSGTTLLIKIPLETAEPAPVPIA